MATVTLTKWGNSMGIRIPSLIIKEAHLVSGEELEIRVDEKKGVLMLIPIKNQQEGWLEKFNAVSEMGEGDNLDIANEFDKDEWTW
jgi:antitoxin component of MazEF toxin-antitoxin module